MAMAEPGERRQVIAAAITAELERQARAGAPRIDVDELARAIEEALAPSPEEEGRRPDELNATNDD